MGLVLSGEGVIYMQVWNAHKHLMDGIASGEVQPLPWTVFSRDKAQDAFRFLAGGMPSTFQCCERLLGCTPDF